MGIDTKGFQPNPDITKEELEAMRIDVADRIIGTMPNVLKP